MEEEPHPPAKNKEFKDLEPIEPIGLIPTKHEIGDNNITTSVWKLRVDIHNPVFGISAGLVILFGLFVKSCEESGFDVQECNDITRRALRAIVGFNWGVEGFGGNAGFAR